MQTERIVFHLIISSRSRFTYLEMKASHLKCFIILFSFILKDGSIFYAFSLFIDSRLPTSILPIRTKIHRFPVNLQ